METKIQSDPLQFVEVATDFVEIQIEEVGSDEYGHINSNRKHLAARKKTEMSRK